MVPRACPGVHNAPRGGVARAGAASKPGPKERHCSLRGRGCWGAGQHLQCHEGQAAERREGHAGGTGGEGHGGGLPAHEALQLEVATPLLAHARGLLLTPTPIQITPVAVLPSSLYFNTDSQAICGLPATPAVSWDTPSDIRCQA